MRTTTRWRSAVHADECTGYDLDDDDLDRDDLDHDVSVGEEVLWHERSRPNG